MRATEHFFIGDAQVLHAVPVEEADDDAALAGVGTRPQRPVWPRGRSGAKALAADGVPEQSVLQEKTPKDQFFGDQIEPVLSNPVAEADIAGGDADAGSTDARRREHGSACHQLQGGHRSIGEVASPSAGRARWSDMQSDSDDEFHDSPAASEIEIPIVLSDLDAHDRPPDGAEDAQEYEEHEHGEPDAPWEAASSPERPREDAPAAAASAASASASAASRGAGAEPAPTGARPHIAVPVDNWALELLVEVSHNLEQGDIDNALIALVRLLLLDERLPREHAFSASYQRERGGWRTILTLATGRLLTGAVKARQRAAYASAMEAAEDYVIDSGLRITQGVVRRQESKDEQPQLHGVRRDHLQSGDRSHASRRDAEAP